MTAMINALPVAAATPQATASAGTASDPADAAQFAGALNDALGDPAGTPKGGAAPTDAAGAAKTSDAAAPGGEAAAAEYVSELITSLLGATAAPIEATGSVGAVTAATATAPIAGTAGTAEPAVVRPVATDAAADSGQDAPPAAAGVATSADPAVAFAAAITGASSQPATGTEAGPIPVSATVATTTMPVAPAGGAAPAPAQSQGGPSTAEVTLASALPTADATAQSARAQIAADRATDPDAGRDSRRSSGAKHADADVRLPEGFALPTPADPAPRLAGAAVPIATAPSEPAYAAAAQAQPELGAALARLRTRLDGTHELTVQLHPAELGAVNVTAVLRDGTLNVTVAVSDPAARAAVTAALPELQQQLSQAGYSGFDLSLGEGGAQHSAGHAGGEQRQPSGDGGQTSHDEPAAAHQPVRRASRDSNVDRWL